MTDNQLLFSSSLLCLILIIISFKFNKLFGIISLIIFVIYSSYLYYSLIYKSQYGSALVWWFYLLIITAIQIIISGTYIIIKLIKNRH
jgi:hypothetical protein